MKPAAKWTPDCQGKQDFDGPLLSISTRFYPGPGGGGAMLYDSRTGVTKTVPYGPEPSAVASILFEYGEEGDYHVWRQQKFSALTEDQVKAEVEGWVAAQMADLAKILGLQ